MALLQVAELQARQVKLQKEAEVNAQAAAEEQGKRVQEALQQASGFHEPTVWRPAIIHRGYECCIGAKFLAFSGIGAGNESS